MKIALVTQEYPPETCGGVGSQTYMKATGLSGLGHEVFIISRSISGERTEKRTGNICVIRIAGMENKIADMREIVKWITYSVSLASEIESLHHHVNLDIIDFPEWSAEAYTHLLNRCAWNYIPTVIQLHGPLVMFAKTINWPEFNSDFYRVGTHMEATCVQLTDAVYSSSECSANWVRSYYSPKQEKIPVIHLGVDTKKFSPLSLEKYQRSTIIFVGKLLENKGVNELVEAACNLVKEFPDLQLRLIGPGEEKIIKLLKEKANALGAPNLLNFSGYVYKDDLPKELSCAHVFAAPSHYEGGPGFVYLEAMACGIPVVGCSGSGLDEIVTSGENGILVPPKNSKALEEALHKLLSDETYRKNTGMKAREYVLQEADSEICLKKLEAFYQSVLKSTVSLIKKKINL